MLSAESPPWLRAVGQLQVPGQRYEAGRKRAYREDCSATLLADSSAHARYLLSAWHCLAYYRDLSQSIAFTLHTLAGERLQRQARVVDSGSDMDSDWALLKLNQPIAASDVPGLPLRKAAVDSGQPLIMAGFSGDGGKGRDGTVMTYDPSCRALPSQDNSKGHSDCIAFKGASGGAVIQVSAGGRAELAGIISAGDGASLSIFTPVHALLPRLRASGAGGVVQGAISSPP